MAPKPSCRGSGRPSTRRGTNCWVYYFSHSEFDHANCRTAACGARMWRWCLGRAAGILQSSPMWLARAVLPRARRARPNMSCPHAHLVSQSKRRSPCAARDAPQPGHYPCRRVQWVADDVPETAVQRQRPSIDAGGTNRWVCYLQSLEIDWTNCCTATCGPRVRWMRIGRAAELLYGSPG